MDNLWHSRGAASTTLKCSYPDILEIMNELFSLLDDCINALSSLNSEFGRITGLITSKARNLALGCYSLSLDSLAQEGGALFRLLIEALELLTYLMLDPQRVDEAIDDRLPSAGEIAKRINGNHKDLRNYLNCHASHLSLGHESMRHLENTEPETPIVIRTEQPFRLAVVLKNLQTLFAVVGMITIKAANCAFVAGYENHPELVEKVVSLRTRGLSAFDNALTKAEG